MYGFSEYREQESRDVDIKFIVLCISWNVIVRLKPHRLVKSSSCDEEQNAPGRVDRFACVQFFTRARSDWCKSDQFKEWVLFLLGPCVSTLNSDSDCFESGLTSVSIQIDFSPRCSPFEFHLPFVWSSPFAINFSVQETRGALIERLANRFERVSL